MTTTETHPTAGTETTPAGLRATARATGLLYLGLAVTAALGFQVVRSQLYVEADPGATLSNLVENTSLASLGILLELASVLTQALVALWFFRLFRSVDSFAAGSIAVFGMVNAVVILSSAAVLATAVAVADDSSLAASGGAAATVQLLYVLSANLWGVGGLFFGLWLIPMGWLVVRSTWMPRPLGWLLMAGGAGYVLSTLTKYALPNADLAIGLLIVPATMGELWIVGYLIIVGVRERPHSGIPSR